MGHGIVFPRAVYCVLHFFSLELVYVLKVPIPLDFLDPDIRYVHTVICFGLASCSIYTVFVFGSCVLADTRRHV